MWIFGPIEVLSMVEIPIIKYIYYHYLILGSW